MIKYLTWTMTVLLLLSYGIAYQYGWLEYLLGVDATRITLIIPAVIAFVSLSINWMTFTKRYPRHFRSQIVYLSSNLPIIGLLGTQIAMFLTLGAGSLEPEIITIGLSMAMLTTIFGLIGSLLTEQMIMQMEEARRDGDSG